MSGYSSFAMFYDRLMTDADYKNRTLYIKQLFQKYDRMPSLLLDFACGTGGFSLEFAQSGIDVIGADPSADMLMNAREKASAKGLDILFLNQDGRGLDLYGTVDGAICCLDSINHITDKRELRSAFKKISLFLEKDRLFIFDVNTVYKHRKVLCNNCFVLEKDELYCGWQNSLRPDNKTVDISLDFFVGDNGAISRYTDEFSERAYAKNELVELLSGAGLKTVAVLSDMSFEKAKKNDLRNVYVTRKL